MATPCGRGCQEKRRELRREQRGRRGAEREAERLREQLGGHLALAGQLALAPHLTRDAVLVSQREASYEQQSLAAEARKTPRSTGAPCDSQVLRWKRLVARREAVWQQARECSDLACGCQEQAEGHKITQAGWSPPLLVAGRRNIVAPRPCRASAATAGHHGRA